MKHRIIYELSGDLPPVATLRCACGATAPLGDSLFATEHGCEGLDVTLEHFDFRPGARLIALWTAYTQGRHQLWYPTGRPATTREAAHRAITDVQRHNHVDVLRQLGLDDVVIAPAWFWLLRDGDIPGDIVTAVRGDFGIHQRLTVFLLDPSDEPLDTAVRS